jgi:hypothetical protein
MQVVPTCPSCSYDLSATAGDTCPECGTRSTLDERWRPAPPAVLIRIATFFALIACCVFAGWWSVHGHNYPSLGAPFNVLYSIPWIGGLQIIGIGLLAAIAALFSWPVLRESSGHCWARLTTHVLGWILSALWFGLGTRYGLQYQGVAYVAFGLFLNVAALAVIIWAARRGRRRREFGADLVFTLVLVVWACTYGFPYLGELP